MTFETLMRDTRFRSWLADRPGLWLEVGVLEDPAILVALIVERRRLGLAPLSEAMARPKRRARRTARTPSAPIAPIAAIAGARP